MARHFFHFLRQHLPLKKQVATKDLNGTCIKYSQDEMGMLSVLYDPDVKHFTSCVSLLVIKKHCSALRVTCNFREEHILRKQQSGQNLDLSNQFGLYCMRISSLYFC